MQKGKDLYNLIVMKFQVLILSTNCIVSVGAVVNMLNQEFDLPRFPT